MKYTTRSTVSVRFRNLDHASAFRKFLEEALKIADKGGDFELAVVEGKNIEHRQNIGHDVRPLEIYPTMDVSEARKEIDKSKSYEQELRSELAKINENLATIAQYTDSE